MDYEKLYREALEKAKIFKKHLLEINDKGYAEEIDYIFPELKESEDERIRKALIALLNFCLEDGSAIAPGFNESKEQAIAWLEKQNHDGKKWIYEDVYLKEKEQLIQDGIDEVLENPQKYGLEKQGEQKSINSIEPKFKVGDWVMLNENHNSIYQVEKIENYHYVLRHILGGAIGEPFGLESLMRCWTIKDAKEGDVLVVNNNVFIYAHRKQLYSIAVAHCFIDSAGNFHFDGEFGYVENGNSTYPATQKQRNTLFAKMKEAGYEWDANKKEIRKLRERI